MRALCALFPFNSLEIDRANMNVFGAYVPQVAFFFARVSLEVEKKEEKKIPNRFFSILFVFLVVVVFAVRCSLL